MTIKGFGAVSPACCQQKRTGLSARSRGCGRDAPKGRGAPSGFDSAGCKHAGLAKKDHRVLQIQGLQVSLTG